MDWALVAAKILQGDATNVPVSQINNLLRSEKQRIKAVFCDYYKDDFFFRGSKSGRPLTVKRFKLGTQTLLQVVGKD